MKKVLYTVLTLFFLQGLVIAAPIDAIKTKVNEMKMAAIKGSPSVTVQELKQVMDSKKKFKLVDVRTQAEYDAGHIFGSILAPRGKVEWMVPGKIKDPNATIYVYCKAGSRGAFATQRLLEVGYKNVINVTGGFRSWAKAGYPFFNAHGKNVIVAKGFGKKK
jgi:rhodanese-related sulfurtransferase